MKQIYFTFVLLLTVSGLFAQAPEAFNYQAVLRDAQGMILANQEVGIQISIIEGNSLNVSAYIETFFDTTNYFGLINLQIGTGDAVVGSFEDIQWWRDRHFVKIEVDIDGGFAFKELGISELLSVPYALHAKTVEIDKVNDADADPRNELQTLSVSGNELSISDGNSVTLPFNIDPTNELQDISLNGFELSISKGSTVNLSTVRDGTGTDNQNLYLSGDGKLKISRGNTITLPYITTELDGDPNNELQVLTQSNDTLFLSEGGFVKLPAEVDPLFAAWDKSSGISITKNQISDLNPEIFEKELTNGENNINVGFVLETTSLVFYNGNILPTTLWAGAGTQTLNINLTTNLYDNLKVKK